VGGAIHQHDDPDNADCALYKRSYKKISLVHTVILAGQCLDEALHFQLQQSGGEL
jgi:hypothetical protein